MHSDVTKGCDDNILLEFRKLPFIQMGWEMKALILLE